MNPVSRRSFIKSSAATVASLGLVPYLTGCKTSSVHSRVIGANDDIRLAVIGFNGQGKSHIETIQKVKGTRIVALCDVDKDILAAGAKQFQDRNQPVATYSDVRRLLEAQDIDAISTATPNHWHSLLTIWACQAGKDVYVEKPVSHNVWEGRQMVEAARKYKRIVQTGTQCRSNPGLREAIQFLRDGNLGPVKVARGLCYKRRASIGKTEGPQPVPPNIDYSLWLGPAPMTPLRRKRLHYDWHWVWPTGSGDLGNQGIHQMDMARWALGIQELSPRVFSVGGRLGYVDDGETPNTQVIYHDYGKALLIFEVRGLPASSAENKMDNYRGASIGVVIDCQNGYLVIASYDKATAFDHSGGVIRKFEGSANHHENFVKAMRSRKPTDLNADILEGHLSSALCHTGNISYRLGRQASPEAIQEAIQGDSEALEACERAYEHLQVNGVDLSQTPATLGAFLRMNPKTERFLDNESANKLLTREYREPFVVPQKV
ncbi:MAG TPA: Gfo/Idh/MocA family oxidoreductase [Candidatus Paceibacterota bacterium]|nr:Gfo/Idh/MocA family oxidoreductase [Verrucomicrobiota bacterium]HRY50113.1 Gfo/Idh/MocA family oxidoreductase [Candidatus Paceibacterota bacterium]HSA02514.1 Gfo/Idh/MocA family oxidoreductase [Candidatus Paceibacterota bacterium]